MTRIGKRIGLAAFSLCFLMAVVVASESRSGSLAARRAIGDKDSKRLRSTISVAANDGQRAAARSSDGSMAFCLPAKNSWPCLQNNIKPEDVVSAALSKPGMSHRNETKVTVDQTLQRLKAHCRKRKLVDANGREIYFYRLAGCWGNPPADYQEILQRQSEELQKLKKHYHVIEMTCNPSGEQIQ